MRPAEIIPPSLRSYLRPVANRLRRAECQVRRVLPTWAGGRFTSQALQVRELEPADATQILALLGIPAEGEHLDGMRKGLSDGDSFTLGLFLRDQLVAQGRCSRQWSHLQIPGYWLSGAYVSRSLRGRGLGRILNRHRIAGAVSRGLPELYVNVSSHNLPNLRCCRAVGFERAHRYDWAQRIASHLNAMGGPARRYVILRRDTALPREP